MMTRAPRSNYGDCITLARRSAMHSGMPRSRQPDRGMSVRHPQCADKALGGIRTKRISTLSIC